MDEKMGILPFYLPGGRKPEVEFHIREVRSNRGAQGSPANNSDLVKFNAATGWSNPNGFLALCGSIGQELVRKEEISEHQKQEEALMHRKTWLTKLFCWRLDYHGNLTRRAPA
jgi:hypothetical protein